MKQLRIQKIAPVAWEGPIRTFSDDGSAQIHASVGKLIEHVLASQRSDCPMEPPTIVQPCVGAEGKGCHNKMIDLRGVWKALGIHG
jgi:hypothetical protein